MPLRGVQYCCIARQFSRSGFGNYCQKIPSAWQYPQDATVSLTVDGFHYDNSPFEKTIKQEAPIVLEGHTIGYIAIHYPAFQVGASSFLQEEKILLAQIANEISIVIERKQQQATRNRNTT